MREDHYAIKFATKPMFNSLIARTHNQFWLTLKQPNMENIHISGDCGFVPFRVGNILLNGKFGWTELTTSYE